ncbi:putative ATPase [Thiobacillus denitrificans ATCC 25259]|uniref:Putative ATPase n=1 Tax=Thiobacillus denitrificans (strain ATCC 25259 / T1) TaxID=292415 RepID=Q3SI83_THIDA|nr:AAA family ATPase [Thiobacillus denitrificans]AAZ97645.1 putative ATPase [Thiobacillus denitrificans ATCC 25259]
MPSSDQLKALLRAHIDGDEERFSTVAMQLAAHEARIGHGKLALELRDLIDKAKTRQTRQPIPLVQPRGEMADLLQASYPKARLADMVLDNSIQSRLDRLIREQRQVEKLRSHGLSPRKKLLLVGPPGTGKTLTASVLAGELNLPLFVVRLDSLMTKFMGETAAKLRLIFDAIRRTRAVYLFDEFDSIGGQRGLGNDVGEIRRVLNSFLQLIEQDMSDSLLIAATNHPDLLDHALFRRFDDVIRYTVPDEQLIVETLKTKLAGYKARRLAWKTLAKAASGLSHGDLTRACEDAIKDAILHDRPMLETADIRATLEERKATHDR